MFSTDCRTLTYPVVRFFRQTHSIIHNPFDIPSNVNNKIFFLSFIYLKSFNFIYLLFIFLSWYENYRLSSSAVTLLSDLSKFKLYIKWFDLKCYLKEGLFNYFFYFKLRKIVKIILNKNCDISKKKMYRFKYW